MDRIRTGESGFLQGYKAVAALGIVGLVGLGVSYYVIKDRVDARQAYTTEFTGDGECLDNTPFDPDKNVLMGVNRIKDTDTLSVLPVDANSHTPSVLFFSIDRKNGISPPSLSPADQTTAAYLQEANCPNQGTGS